MLQRGMALAVPMRYLPATFVCISNGFSMSREKFYLTTPIFYPNGKPHIGHAYNVIATRCPGALSAPRRQGRFLRLGNRRAWLEDAADGGRRGPDADSARRPQFGDLPLDARSGRLLERCVHPHHRATPLQGLPGDLGTHGGERRYLSRSLQRLVFGPAGSVFRRERNHGRGGWRAPRTARLTGRVDRGRELLLPPFRLSGPVAEAL